MIPQLELYDICLLIIYLFVIYLTAILFVQKKKKENSVYRYFIPALSLKIAGGLVYALYHVYVYKGGDTFGFYDGARALANYVSIFDTDTMGAFFGDYKPHTHNIDTWYEYALGGKDVYFVVKITSFFYLLGAGSYYTVTVLFSVISFLGLWSLFVTISKLHNLARKIIFYAMFTLPTMLMWSSGVLKDTITIGVLGVVVSVVANVFIFNKNKLLNSIYFILCIYIIYILKPYLAYLLLPALFIWVQANIKDKIDSNFIKILITPLLFLSIIIAGYYTLSSLSESAGKYSIDNWESTLQGFHSWHGHLAETRDQSGYSLGEMEYTVFGVLAKAPAAINVTFFRPYLWEVRNIATLLGAIEALFLLVLTIYVLFKSRTTVFQSILKNKEVLFLLSFAIPFAFIVGLSSYNFGALSRYKIPAELFYLMALALIYKNSLREKG
jgi:hypothetical protein